MGVIMFKRNKALMGGLEVLFVFTDVGLLFCVQYVCGEECVLMANIIQLVCVGLNEVHCCDKCVMVSTLTSLENNISRRIITSHYW